MHRHSIPYCLCLVFCFGSYACRKNTPAPPSSPSGTQNINLIIPYVNSPGLFTFELILSEPSGKILLDTVTTSNEPIKAALKTNVSLLDITTIARDSMNYYSIDVHKSVNPTNWVYSVFSDYRVQYNLPAYSPAQLFCSHVPAGALDTSDLRHDFILNNGAAIPFNGESYDTSHKSLTINYQRTPNGYNYLLLPYIGLYKLYKPSSAYDTLDLSNLDTAVELTLNRTVPFTIFWFAPFYNTMLTGIPDTTDLTKAICFSTNSALPNSDFAIPKIPMQKYELFIDAANSLHDEVGFYSYNSSIPTTPIFPDPSSFTVQSKQNNDFAVTFSSNPPTYYYTEWISPKNNLTLELYSSSDSTVHHPLSFITALNSKLLHGLDLTDLFVELFRVETVTGYNYASFNSYMTNPSLLTTRRVASASRLTRTLF